MRKVERAGGRKQLSAISRQLSATILPDPAQWGSRCPGAQVGHPAICETVDLLLDDLHAPIL
jgi:hypothetical protein